MLSSHCVREEKCELRTMPFLGLESLHWCSSEVLRIFHNSSLSEGFATWMFQGLTFLLPFLIVMYVLEFFNSYTLYSIWRTQECVWQVSTTSVSCTAICGW